MALLYLVRGNEIIAVIDTENQAVVALPLLGGVNNFSLIDVRFAEDIGLANGKTATQILSDANLVDAREVGIGAMSDG